MIFSSNFVKHLRLKKPCRLNTIRDNSKVAVLKDPSLFIGGGGGWPGDFDF